MHSVYTRGQTSVILRVEILDSSVSTGAGKTGLAHNTSGLVISTIADNESSPTIYTAAASNIEDIATLGAYQAPTSGKCRFKEVHATNDPGAYEIQLADARFAVAGAKSLKVKVFGAANASPCPALIPLHDFDPYSIGHGLAQRGIVYGTVDVGATTTSIPTSSLTPSPTGTNQLKGRILVFLSNTATSNLRGQASDITASTSGGTLTVTSLTNAPASGDIFVIM